MSLEVPINNEDDLSECPICLSTIPSRSFVWTSPCAHTYCVECISRWLTSSSNCPFCRLDIEHIEYGPNGYLVDALALPCSITLNIWPMHMSHKYKLRVQLDELLVGAIWRSYQPILNPTFSSRFQYVNDVQFFFAPNRNDVVFTNDNAISLGLTDGGTIFIKHHINLLWRLDGSPLSETRHHVHCWLDQKIRITIQHMLEVLSLGIDEVYIVYKGDVINNIALDDTLTLHNLSCQSGDTFVFVRRTNLIYGNSIEEVKDLNRNELGMISDAITDLVKKDVV